MGMVDVRDVAEAHLKAIKLDEAKNRRFMLVSRCAWRREMAETLAAEFNSKGWNVNVAERTDDKPFGYEVDNTISREVLGINYVPLEKSWVDMAQALIDSGYIQKPAGSE